jgi:hypothetical protein
MEDEKTSMCSPDSGRITLDEALDVRNGTGELRSKETHLRNALDLAAAVRLYFRFR